MGSTKKRRRPTPKKRPRISLRAQVRLVRGQYEEVARNNDALRQELALRAKDVQAVREVLQAAMHKMCDPQASIASMAAQLSERAREADRLYEQLTRWFRRSGMQPTNRSGLFSLLAITRLAKEGEE